MAYYVDSLLFVRDGATTARWNFGEAVGSSRESPTGIGEAANLTYSFMSTSPDYYAQGIPLFGQPSSSFQPLEATQQIAVRQALDTWAAVADLNFTEVADSGAGGLIRFGRFDFTNTAALAYAPSYGFTYDARGTILTVTPQDIAGDIWLSSAAIAGNDSQKPGEYGFSTLLHEIGHTLGLKHPFEGSTMLPSTEDNWRYTLMAYNAMDDLGIAEVSGSPSDYTWVTSTLAPRTPMLYDIAALQYLYGANAEYNASDTTYAWVPNERFLATIWDGDGVDSIDTGNQTLPSIIDLNAGQFSSIGMRLTEAERRLEIPSWATAVTTPSYDGQHNLAIAFGVTIENARGGAGNDHIIGNVAANRLGGGAGLDTLIGAHGDDVIDGGDDIDTAHFDGLQSRFIVSIASGGGLLVTDMEGIFGSDLLLNVERLSFTDGTIDTPLASETASITLGTGADALVLRISQDAYQGSAQYTLAVNGVQIGGMLTATALQSDGLYDTITLLGTWGSGQHSLAVTFLNDAWGGTAATDRNLYIDGLVYNGVAQTGGTASLMSAGPAVLGFADGSSAPQPGSGALPPDGAQITLGSGPDALVLALTQDAYEGSAQYMMAVDGAQIGSTQTAVALRGSGSQDVVTLLGDWASGGHSVTITFLNDAWGGTVATDRNLHVEGVTYNDIVQPGGSGSLMSAGPLGFAFADTGLPSLPSTPGGIPSPGQGGQAFQGTASTDEFYGTNGDDVLTGGPGNDWMQGGSGADSYVFQAGDGPDWVEDFVSGQDRVVLLGVTAASVSWAPATHWGNSGVQLNYGTDHVFLVGPVSFQLGDILYV